MKTAVKKENPTCVVDPEEAVLTVIRRYPAAREVFAKYGLDACCGGIHPVAMAAAAHGMDLQALLAELDAAARKSLEAAPE